MTDKQEKFCREYVIDWNKTQAAIRAGYSKKTAMEQGYQLLQKTSVQERILELKTKTAELAGLSALKNALQLKKIAFGSLSNFIGEDGKLKVWSDLSEDDKSIVSEIRQSGSGENVNTTIKIPDSLKAIEMLNKMFGWNQAEKVSIETNVPIESIFDKLIGSVKPK